MQPLPEELPRKPSGRKKKLYGRGDPPPEPPSTVNSGAGSTVSADVGDKASPPLNSEDPTTSTAGKKPTDTLSIMPASTESEALRVALLGPDYFEPLEPIHPTDSAPLFLDKPDRSAPWQRICSVRTHEVYKWFDEQVRR